MTNRGFIFFLAFALIAGAGQAEASKRHKSLQEEASLYTGKVLFLDSPLQHASRLDKFMKQNPRSEYQKIAYLLNSIRVSKAEFVRNGVEYNSDQAARFLRFKITCKRFRQSPIRTARDFVDLVASGSATTGQPYEVVLADGRHKLHDVLAFELAAVEARLDEIHDYTKRDSSEGLMYGNSKSKGLQNSNLVTSAR